MMNLADNSTICFEPIGYVQNDIDQPVSSSVIRERTSHIVIKKELVEGLQGLEPGQEILVIFHFHRAPENNPLMQHPRGDRNQPLRGVFALRSPHRPNAIGVTVVDLVTVEKNVLKVQGLDAINQTPVLDIKPV